MEWKIVEPFNVTFDVMFGAGAAAAAAAAVVVLKLKTGFPLPFDNVCLAGCICMVRQ